MIEPIMYFGIGFLFAALIGIIIVPLIHARAVRLTVRRLEAATPLSMAEIQAEARGDLDGVGGLRIDARAEEREVAEALGLGEEAHAADRDEHTPARLDAERLPTRRVGQRRRREPGPRTELERRCAERPQRELRIEDVRLLDLAAVGARARQVHAARDESAKILPR